MDAHIDQVQKARAHARGGETRSYFAYSTVLDRPAFEEWRAQHGYLDFELPEGQLAEARDVGLVFDFPSRWWGGRVAGLSDAKGQRVCGRLFTIAAENWPIVQHKEGFITGMCVRREVQVQVQPGGASTQAVAFVTAYARRSLDGPVSARFMRGICRGAARTAGVSRTPYLEELRARACWLAEGGRGRGTRRPRAEAIAADSYERRACAQARPAIHGARISDRRFHR